VKLDKVKAVNFSSDSSSPVARQILEFLFDYYNISPTEDITDKEREEYKMYADRLKAFLGTDTNNSQEATSSSNIQRQINEEGGDATTGDVTANDNTNSGKDGKDKKLAPGSPPDRQAGDRGKKDNKNNSPAPSTLLNGGVGD
jgi:hypothetical protein